MYSTMRFDLTQMKMRYKKENIFTKAASKVRNFIASNNTN